LGASEEFNIELVKTFPNNFVLSQVLIRFYQIIRNQYMFITQFIILNRIRRTVSKLR